MAISLHSIPTKARPADSGSKMAWRTTSSKNPRGLLDGEETAIYVRSDRMYMIAESGSPRLTMELTASVWMGCEANKAEAERAT